MTLIYHTNLTAPDLRKHGIPAPWSFGLADRVRFGELDAIGHVNHTAYLRWFESFRRPYLAARHITNYGPKDPRLVLKQVHCTFVAEMFAGEDYIVTGRTSAFRRTSFTMDYAVWRIDEDVTRTAQGGAVIVLLNREGEGRFPLPEAGRTAFEAEDGAVFDG